ncbi:MAG: AIM24 family protein [Phycisphaerales bacterium]|nr:AIM24 family protein [Phycisphaerales bacterium]
MPAQTIAEFVSIHADKDRGNAAFELESDYFLQCNLESSRVWIKTGAMVAYRGDIRFVREGLLDQGLGNLLKKAVSGEGAQLTKAEGSGDLYLADKGKRITLLHLNNESIFVNGSDLLAFQDGMTNKITLMRKIGAMAAGGLFNVQMSGTGVIALTTHHRPLALPVTPSAPVFTDPQATVAWSGSLSPEFKTDIQLKTLLGRGSGESFQMKFAGQGFVIVQPYEESPMQQGTPG